MEFLLKLLAAARTGSGGGGGTVGIFLGTLTMNQSTGRATSTKNKLNFSSTSSTSYFDYSLNAQNSIEYPARVSGADDSLWDCITDLNWKIYSLVSHECYNEEVVG